MGNDDFMKPLMLAIGLVCSLAVILMMKLTMPSVAWDTITGNLASMFGGLILFFMALVSLVYIMGKRK